MFFESAMDSRLQPMNRANLTSLYIPVREERPSEAESVHTTAQARADQSMEKRMGQAAESAGTFKVLSISKEKYYNMALPCTIPEENTVD